MFQEHLNALRKPSSSSQTAMVLLFTLSTVVIRFGQPLSRLQATLLVCSALAGLVYAISAREQQQKEIELRAIVPLFVWFGLMIDLCFGKVVLRYRDTRIHEHDEPGGGEAATFDDQGLGLRRGSSIDPIPDWSPGIED